MNLPFSFPPWVPWWVPLAVLVPALLYGLVFLAMPFSVFGVKTRLDILEARLDEIQGEIRSLVLRLPERGQDPDGDYEAPPRARREAIARPPIPPAPIFREAPSVRDARITRDEDRDDAARADRPRFGGDAELRRRLANAPPAGPPPPPPPARRAEPRIDWPRAQS
jgi:hypothetical protein